MNLTTQQLTSKIERWQAALAPLGLAHWSVDKVTLGKDSPGGSDNAKATCMASWHYDEVSFWFSSDWVKESNKNTLDVTIVHEWLHAAFRDIDSAMDVIGAWMPPATLTDFRDRLMHEEEGLIQRLAVLIVQLHTN